MSAPLIRLLCKEELSWGPKEDVAFEHLKTAMTSTPVLVMPDFSKPFVIECNAKGLELVEYCCKMGDRLLFAVRLCQAKSCLVYLGVGNVGCGLYGTKWRHYLMGTVPNQN